MGRWQSLVAYWGMGAIVLFYAAVTVVAVVLLAWMGGGLLYWGLELVGLAKSPFDFQNRYLDWFVLLVALVFAPYLFSIVMRNLGVVPATLPKPFRLPQSAADTSQTSHDARQ